MYQISALFMNSIEIRNLQKTYNTNVVALKNISLDIKKGDFFALLGQNGAGKTTTIGILTGLVTKTKGEVFVNGISIDKNFQSVKKYIGVVPQEFNFFIFAKVIDIVLDQAGYYGISREESMSYAEYLLKKLQLWDKRNQEARTLSGGMKRRLMIARGLIHKPDILLLDEPSAGVDIELRRSMWDFLKELHQQGLTIVLTTHYLEEVEQLCNNLAIIANGEIVKTGNVKEIIAEYKQETFILHMLPLTEEIQTSLGEYSNITQISSSEIHIKLNPHTTLMECIDEIPNIKPYITSIKPKENALEEIFLTA